VNKTKKRAGEVKKHGATDRGFNMRWRFAEQIKRFWRESMKKNNGDLPRVGRKQDPSAMTE
jgi:hypothetical protein